MSSDDQLLLSVRSDFPDVSALMKVDKNTTFADFRTKVAAELKLKEHVDKYEYSAVAFATDVLSLPVDEKSLTSSLSALGVRSRSTILLYAPSELRPVRKLPSKKDKKKAKARKPLDDVFAGFTPKNIIKKLESGTLGTKKEKLAKEFIDIYAEDVVKSPAFLEAKLSTVEGIASSNTLNIPEGELFAGVVNWARAECKRQDTTDLKSVLTTVLPHIRFPQMSTQDVATKVSPTGLLTDTQVLEIFTYLGAAQSTKDPSSLPRISWPAMPRKARKPRNWFTWNPEKKTANLQLADENTTVVSTVQSWQSVFGNTELVKGVYEFNIVLEQYDTSNSFNVAVGVVPVSDTGYNSGTLIGYSGQQGWAFITGTGATCNQASPVNSSVGACKQGDTICTRVDLDQNTIEWIVNPGQGERTTGVIYRNVNGPVLPAVSVIGNSRIKLEFPRFRNL